MIGKDKIRITITVKKELNEKLKKLAEEDNRTVSNYLEELIKKI